MTYLMVAPLVQTMSAIESMPLSSQTCRTRW